MSDTDSTIIHFGFLALDAVLTLILFTYGLGGFTVLVVGMGGMTVWEFLFQYIPSSIYRGIMTGDGLVGISLVSTFFTSIWIWLYAIAGLALQGSTSLFGGMAWMRELFDVENRPVQALGLMLAILTTSGFLLSLPLVL